MSSGPIPDFVRASLDLRALEEQLTEARRPHFNAKNTITAQLFDHLSELDVPCIHVSDEVGYVYLRDGNKSAALTEEVIQEAIRKTAEGELEDGKTPEDRIFKTIVKNIRIIRSTPKKVVDFSAQVPRAFADVETYNSNSRVRQLVDSFFEAKTALSTIRQDNKDRLDELKLAQADNSPLVVELLDGNSKRIGVNTRDGREEFYIRRKVSKRKAAITVRNVKDVVRSVIESLGDLSNIEAFTQAVLQGVDNNRETVVEERVTLDRARKRGRE